jgi:hypothetical protein
VPDANRLLRLASETASTSNSNRSNPVERKHRTQFTEAEIVYTETLVHGIREWDFSKDHVLERMAEKKISKADLVNTLTWGEVIEVNDRGRVVLRLKNGKRKGVCVVASIADRVLVTAWYNKPTDNHATLNESEYQWKVDVIKYLRSLA